MMANTYKFRGVSGTLRASGYTQWSEIATGQELSLIWEPKDVGSVQEGIEHIKTAPRPFTAYVEFWPDQPVDIGCLRYGMFYLAVVHKDGGVSFPHGKRGLR
jgi:hypothetical protein